MKPKTLKDFDFMNYPRQYYMPTSGGTWCPLNKEQEEIVDSVINELRQEQIKWIKGAKEMWVTDLHEDNSHFVLDAWMESLNITEEDLK